ncbi:MAG: cytochrome c [Deltaproteobacteria bacterium]|nr:cytochrome c [Deltaproteobacteria bacterium]MCL5879780.1 cytochrome c [Deltaproteobacteria bacterium]MDA8303937.1 cytochrome c [Deltaproteobacteria bacterium]
MKENKIILRLFLFFFFIFYGVNVVFAASGRTVFETKGCINCHTINGSGGNMGPNLSNVGSRKSLEWIKDFVKNPNNYFNPGGSAFINGKKYTIMMPSFKNMLSTAELNAVANYLESLK